MDCGIHSSASSDYSAKPVDLNKRYPCPWPTTSTSTTATSTTTSTAATSTASTSATSTTTSASMISTPVSAATPATTVSTAVNSVKLSTSSVVPAAVGTPLHVALSTSHTTASSTGAPNAAIVQNRYSQAVLTAMSAIHDIGCTWLVAMLSLVLVVSLALRIFSFERCVHYGEEVTLLIGHVFMLTLRRETGSQIICTVAGIAMQVAFTSHFGFLLADAGHAFAFLTSIVNGPIAKLATIYAAVLELRRIAVTAVALGVLTATLYLNNYPSTFVCMVNFDHVICFAIAIPTTILAALALIFADSAGSLIGKRMPLQSKEEFETVRFNQSYLLLLTTLGYTHWFFGALALHYENPFLIPIVFGLTVALAIFYVKRAIVTDAVFRRWFARQMARVRGFLKLHVFQPDVIIAQ